MNFEKGKITIYVVPQQHWDPFWHFAPEVAERMGLRNLRKALDITKEEPDFKYTSGQVYLWELFEKHFPTRVEELKQRVKEGRIELTNGGYANPDFNLPSGESLIRNLAYAQKVWQKDFGVRPEICWVQDSFGQSGQLPQIFLKMDIKYHTSKRGASRNLPGVFIWEGVDGSKIILDRQPLGHHGIVFFPPFSVLPSRTNPNEKLEKMLKPFSFPMAIIALYFWDPYIWMSTKGRAHSFREALKYLVGCYPDNEILVLHGFSADAAMPVAWICYLAHTYSRLSKNDMLISLPSTFFKSLENKIDKLTVVRGELNGPTGKYGEAFGALPGTYSARIDVKQRARQSERSLYLTEFLEAMRLIKKGKGEDLIAIWKLKFLNDFHDGICGSLTDDNYFFLKEKAELLIQRCGEITQRNLELLAPKEGIFNPLPWSRTDLVEIDGEPKLIEAGPAGFSQFKQTISDKKFVFRENQRILTTPFYRVEWPDNNLAIYQNGEKITGEKFCRLRLQKENGDTYFWDVSGEEWNKISSIELVEWQGLKAILKIESNFRRIKITQFICFYHHTPRVDFKTVVDNKEKNMRLQVHLPFGAIKNSEVIREIPAGFIREGDSSGQASWAETFPRFAYYDHIKGTQNWLYFNPTESAVGEGLAIFNDGLPEHEIVDESCYITLLRCVGRLGTEGKWLNKFQPPNVPWRAGSPFPIPLAQMQGKYEFRYAFCPVKRQEVVRQCYEFLFPLVYCQGNAENQDLFLFSIADPSIVSLAVKIADNQKGIILRLLETEGRGKIVVLNLNFEFKSAKITNLLEEPLKDLVIENNTVRISFKSQEIMTILLKI